MYFNPAFWLVQGAILLYTLFKHGLNWEIVTNFLSENHRLFEKYMSRIAFWLSMVTGVMTVLGILATAAYGLSTDAGILSGLFNASTIVIIILIIIAGVFIIGLVQLSRWTSVKCRQLIKDGWVALDESCYIEGFLAIIAGLLLGILAFI